MPFWQRLEQPGITLPFGSRLLESLPGLAADPMCTALPVPNRSLVFVRGFPSCRLAVTFLLAEQFKTIHVIAIDDLWPSAGPNSPS